MRPISSSWKHPSKQSVKSSKKNWEFRFAHGVLSRWFKNLQWYSMTSITTQVLHWVVIFYCRFHLCWGSATGQITNERHHFMQDPSPILRTPPILSSIASLGSVQIIPANCPKSYSRNCTRISGLVWNKFYKSHCNLPMKKAPRHPSSLGGCLFYQVGNTCFTLWILHVSFQLCLCTIYACFYNYKYIQL